MIGDNVITPLKDMTPYGCRDKIHRIGFTATHGLEHADKGPFFLWLNGKCNNALTINSWWHQNFIMEIAPVEPK